MLGIDERMVGDAWTNIGVLAERFAGSDVQALEPASLRSGDGGLEEHLGAQQRLPRARLDAGRITAQINFFADLDGLDLEGRAGRLQNLERGVHDFRPDAVSVSYGDGSFRGHKRKYPPYRNAREVSTV